MFWHTNNKFVAKGISCMFSRLECKTKS